MGIMEKGKGIRFIADDMVGKLAKWLRILGYDVLYYRSIANDELVRKAKDEERVLLTKDTKLRDAKDVNCIFVKDDDYLEQLDQVMEELKLEVDDDKIFSRCLICNGLLEDISKKDVEGKVPPFVYETREKFSFCRNCNKIYWQATHTDRVLQRLKRFK